MVWVEIWHVDCFLMIWWNDDFYVQQQYRWLSIRTYCRWNEVGATWSETNARLHLWGNVMIRVWFIFAMIRCVFVHDLSVRMHRTSSIHFRRCWICLSLLGRWVTVGFLSVMEYQYETATKFPPFLSIVLDDMEKHGIWQSHRKEKKNQLRKHELGVQYVNVCGV